MPVLKSVLKIICLFYIPIFLIPAQICAQVTENVTIYDDFEHFADVSGGLFLAPLHFDQSDWETAILSLSLTAVSFHLDHSVHSIAHASQSKLNHQIFGLDRHFGGRVTLSLAAGIYGAGWLFESPRWRRAGLHAFESYILTWSITKLLKYSFGRKRPYAGGDPLHFNPFRGGDRFSSLPSGHTTGAFSFAFAMSHIYKDIYWKSLCFSSAVLVAGARIYRDQHWISDTALSFVISYYVTEYVVHYSDNISNSEPDRQLSIRLMPYINPDAIGVSCFLSR